MDYDQLKSLYVDKEMTANEIANYLDVSLHKVKYSLKKFQIPTRNGGRRNNSIKVIGKKFGKITPIEETKNKYGKLSYTCLCECGNICERTYSSLSDTSCCWSCRNVFISEIKWMGHGQISLDFWTTVEKSAKIRNLNFDITIEFAFKLLQKQNFKCALSGLDIELSRSKKVKRPTASIDRIDSSKGYTEDNVQWVHKDINKMKNNYKEEYFVFLCKQVSSNTLDVSLDTPYVTEPVMAS